MPVAPHPLVFSVRPHTTNVGNDLIALGTQTLLDLAWGERVDVVSLPSTGPGRGAKAAGLTSRNVHEVNLLADAVLVGGGNVFENGALTVQPTALDALQTPLAILGVSTGRVRGIDGSLHQRTDGSPITLVRDLCRHADPVLVRDLATFRHLTELGVPDVILGGCPSLLLGHDPRALPDPDPTLEGVCLLSVRHPRLMSVPYAEQARVQRDVEAVIRLLRQQVGDVALLCHDVQDLAFAAAFPDVRVRYTEDPRTMLAWLRGCALAVGYRLHGFLACVALGVQALHISYDERGESMIETLGLEAFDIRMADHPRVGAALGERLSTMGNRTPGAEAETVTRGYVDVLVDATRALAVRAGDRRALQQEMTR